MLSIITFLSFNYYAEAAVPNCATALAPATGGTIVSSSTPFTWTAPSTGTPATGYYVYIGTTTAANELVNGTSVTATTYTYGGTFTCGTTYYWKIIPYNASGPSTGTCATTPLTFTLLATPTVAAGTAISTCGTAVANIFTGSSASGYTSITWTSNGSGTFANANSLTTATYTPSAADVTAGSRTLTLTAVGSCATVTSTKTITITTPPTVGAGTAIATCGTSAVNITAGSSAANYGTITWTSSGTGGFTNNGSLTATTYTPTAADVTAGTRILTLTATGTGTCTSVTSTKNITITATPTAVAGTAINTCSNSGAVNITTGSSSTNNSGILWTSSGTGSFANPTSLTLATYTPSGADITAGSVTLTLTANGNGTCVPVTSTKTLTIKTLPVATFSYTGTPYCTNGTNPSPTFSGGGVAGVFTATGGLGFVSTTTGVINLATVNPGTTVYTVTNTIAAGGGCAVVTATSGVTLNSAPVITSQPASTVTTCSGNNGSVTFQAAATGTSISYQWLENGVPLTNGGIYSGVTTNLLALNNPTVANNYSVVVSGLCGPNATSNVATFTPNALAAPGTPSVYGNGVWNAYCYSSVNFTNYTGYYVEPSLSFDSRTRWASGLSPSLASGYLGCSVPATNMSISFKQTNFTPGTYNLSVNFQDDGFTMFLNGTQVFQNLSYTNTLQSNVWTGTLGASDQVEFRLTQGGGGSGLQVTFAPIATPASTITAGTIGGNQFICNGDIPAQALSNVASPVTTGCSLAGYQWQSSTDSLTWTPISGAVSATYTIPSGLTVTTWYNRIAIGACGATATSTPVKITVYSTPPGNSSVFPANVWNGYVFDQGPAGAWSTGDNNWVNYKGFFPVNSLSFNSTTLYTTTSSPATAPGYTGCQLATYQNTGVQFKRQGFPVGTYSIDFSADDAGYLYINGTLVSSRTTNGSSTAVWIGSLDATSTIDFHYKNNGGGGSGSLTFNLIPTPTLIAGTIAGDQILCPNNDPLPFTSTAVASGLCSSVIAYQWQNDVGCTGTFTDIALATNATYNAPVLTQTTCYRRAVIDANCARTAYTNTVTVTITTVQQGDPSIFPLNTWNGYVYDFTNVNGGVYNAADVDWTDYKGFFTYSGISAANVGFNTSTIYTVANTPSAAPGYAGCQVIPNLSGVSFKRQGFPTGTYQIDFDSDNAGYLYINGVLVYGRTGCCAVVSNVWTGNLDASSTIEYHYKNANDVGNYGRLNITLTIPTVPLYGGIIALSGPNSVCSGNTPSIINSTDPAVSSCYLTYQWQSDDGSGYADIAGANAATYSPTAITLGTNYRRNVSDACGQTSTSNIVTVAIGPPVPVDTSVTVANAWVAYVYNAQNYLASSLSGSYIDNGTSSTDPSFNSASLWALNSTPSLAPSYTGCQVGVDNHSVIYKRTGFTTGTYSLNVMNDDACTLYINGLLVYSRGAYTPTYINAVWIGNLNASSEVEFRWTEGTGNSQGAITFVSVTPPTPLLGGTIANTTTTVCSGDSPNPFTSTAAASGGCYATYQWQSNSGSGYTDIAGATLVTYTPTAITVPTSYRRKATDACTAVAYSNVISIAIGAPLPLPNASVFGSNVWNVYAYNDVTYTTLRGSYVDNGFSATNPSFDSRNSWGVNSTPSAAAGYQGCSVNADQHGVIYKRQGFPVGTYRLDYLSDDAGAVYINGVLVYTSVSWGALVTNVWTGPLNASSTVEFRWADTGGGSSYGQLSMVYPVTPTTLLGGTISSTTPIVCSGNIPAPFTSTADASGGCYATYQWQSSTTSSSTGYTDISGATLNTYIPGSISVTTYYRRKATDACGTVAYSNVFTVTVGVPSPPTLTWGIGAWNAYVYNGRNFTTLYGSYVENNTSAVNYSFDTRNSWTSAPSTSAGYSGCQVGTTNFSVSYRQLLAAGTYQFDAQVDDDVVIIINGVTVYTGTGICCTPQINVWTATLPANSQVEIRYGQSGGGAYCKLTITSTTPANLLPGTIGSNQSICSTVVPAALTSVADATSGCSITYQWQNSTTSSTGPWTNIGGNSKTYTPAAPGVTQTTYYRRKATDACSRIDSSNVITVTVNPKPGNAGAITGPLAVCSASGSPNVTYSIAAVANATTYLWTLPTGVSIVSGAGTNSIVANFSTSAVSGTVQVLPQNACGNGLFSSISVVVTSAIPPSAGAITGLSTVCSGQFSVAYSVPAVASATSYTWVVPTGATIISGATTNSILVTFASTSGNVTVTPVNGCGNAAAATSLAVTVNPFPGNAGAITGLGSVCPNQTGVTYSIAAVANATSYGWSLPSGATITAGSGTASITVSFGTTGGNIIVTPINSCGNGGVTSKSLSVLTLPAAAAAITGQTVVCPASTGAVYSIPVAVAATSYIWTIPSGASITSGANTNAITVNFGSAVGGTFTVTPSNSCGTGAMSSLSISFSNTVCPLTWIGVTSTAWNTPTNWSTTIVPTSTNAITIPASGVPFMPTVSASSDAKSIVNNGTITLASGGTLNAYASVTNNGTVNSVAGSKLVFKGTTASTVSGIPTLFNMELNNTAGLTVSTPLTLNGTLILTAGTLSTGNKVKINIDGGGNIGFNSGNVGSVSGNVTVYRNVVSNTTHYISCPLDGVTAADLADNAQVINPVTTKTRLFQYNTPTFAWTPVNSLSTTLSPGTAYSMWFPTPTLVDFTGTYNHAAGYSYSSPNVATKFMFVSNPYPSTLDWEAASGWTKTGIMNATYFWNPTTNSYASYVSGQGTNTATQYIPAMNSFFVAYDGNASFPTATVAMTNSVRTSTYASMWRTAADETVRLTLKSSTASDDAIIRFNEDATNDFDNELDAYKFLNASSVPSIYTTYGATKYSINSIASPSVRDTIPVFTKLPADGDYVLSITCSDPTLQYILVDKKLGTRTVVKTMDYTYLGLKTDSINRFDLLRETLTTGVNQASTMAEMQIASSPNGGFVVKSNMVGLSTIEILDATGNRVKVLTNVSLTSGNNFFTPSIPDGLYVIKVTMVNISFAGQVSIVK
ncbi:hypothetical protein [Cytophaga aurantiaca]|uniref:hypothetical protein n=1 Tax=Cytophaga aurantiaca TaxID=29530 RepID=UPI00035EDD5F|nr:hypothetical protein [Cytophaga aurantiaca]